MSFCGLFLYIFVYCNGKNDRVGVRIRIESGRKQYPIICMMLS